MVDQAGLLKLIIDPDLRPLSESKTISNTMAAGRDYVLKRELFVCVPVISYLRGDSLALSSSKVSGCYPIGQMSRWELILSQCPAEAKQCCILPPLDG